VVVIVKKAAISLLERCLGAIDHEIDLEMTIVLRRM